MLYRYRGLQKLVLADEEKQEFSDLWIDFLRIMWKMSHKANIKVIIFLQGLTSNLCRGRVSSPWRADTHTLQCHHSVTVQLQRVMFCRPQTPAKSSIMACWSTGGINDGLWTHHGRRSWVKRAGGWLLFYLRLCSVWFLLYTPEHWSSVTGTQAVNWTDTVLSIYKI